CISRGLTMYQTGTVPLCSTSGSTSTIDRTSIPHLRDRFAAGDYADAVRDRQRSRMGYHDSMESSVTIGRIRGVDVAVHWTVLFVLALVTLSLAAGIFPDDVGGYNAAA